LVTVVQIERKHGLTPPAFAREHLRGTATPLIVTGAIERWTARSKWTFEFMKAAYGSDLVCAELGLESGIGRMTTLAAYVDYVNARTESLDGFWVDVASGRPLRDAPELPAVPPYLVSWHAFQKHPELLHDIEPVPDFVDDWVLALSPSLRETFERTARREYWELFIGPEGSLSNFHQDYRHTHAYLAQILGRKRVMLFSPEDFALVSEGHPGPGQPEDLSSLALPGRATAYEGVLNPGELLFIPADWWHWVRGLEKSITVSHNFFNDVNFSAHVGSMLDASGTTR
jgi:hypothetical protein